MVLTLASISFIFLLLLFPPPLKNQHFRNLVQTGPVQLTKIHHVNVLHASLKACLLGGGGSQIGEVICGGSPHLSCKRDQIKMRDYMNGQVTSPKRVTSPSWVSPPPCKQALNHNLSFLFYLFFSLQNLLVTFRLNLSYRFSTVHISLGKDTN